MEDILSVGTVAESLFWRNNSLFYGELLTDLSFDVQIFYNFETHSWQTKPGNDI